MFNFMFILQDAQKGVGVFLLISSDGIKVISADGQVKYWLVLLTRSTGSKLVMSHSQLRFGRRCSTWGGANL